MSVARGQFDVQYPAQPTYTIPAGVASGAATTIVAGSPVKAGTAGNVVPCVTGDGTTSQRIIGIAKSDSTDTATAAGTVNVWAAFPGVVFKGSPLLTTAATTAAALSALFYKRVKFSLVSSVWTIDTAQADSTSNGILIVGGDYKSNTVYFIINQAVSFISNVTS